MKLFYSLKKEAETSEENSESAEGKDEQSQEKESDKDSVTGEEDLKGDQKDTAANSDHPPSEISDSTPIS